MSWNVLLLFVPLADAQKKKKEIVKRMVKATSSQNETREPTTQIGRDAPNLTTSEGREGPVRIGPSKTESHKRAAVFSNRKKNGIARLFNNNKKFLLISLLI